MRPHLYRVILPVSDMDRAEEFYTELLGFQGERLFYARDPFDNPICFVDEKTVFTGTSG